MAQRLNEFGPVCKCPCKYPWGEWLNGSAWRLTEGVDFQVGRVSLKSSIHQAAKSRGLIVVTKMHDELGVACIDLQVVGHLGPAAAAMFRVQQKRKEARRRLVLKSRRAA